VFGSLARDEAGTESDVDIVFETDDSNLFRTAHLRQGFEEWLGCPVHIVRRCPAICSEVVRLSRAHFGLIAGPNSGESHEGN
jgi:predicted nucleotidyltransferase